ncbi:DNA-3-methyladenine glycosylase family protein [Actinoplanes sp. CA-051413]|uniref:DNA-3-methyladenine glycosylase family protein n=1 Tax=Actinoplanes sp. CA-051413 TaxID=3239899 RepID=UPI003D96F734
MTTFRMRARGPFSLRSAARFVAGFSAGQGGGDEARLDLAFPAEHGWTPVGVRVTGDGAEPVAEVVANPGPVPAERIRAQVERILSLDVDGTGFPAVGERDPVVGELQTRYPGLRPVQFHSPYEAAVWTIIGQRIRRSQAAGIRTRLATQLGEQIDFGDAQLPSFPAPDRLAGLREFPGLTSRKIEQLQSVGRAADDGQLDAATLRALPAAEALTRLQTLPGIGPFSAELILLRGAGDPDAFPRNEKRLHHAMAGAYRLGDDPGLAQLEAIAERWRPYRTWVALLLRASLAEAGQADQVRLSR